ncbi:MAG: response regulator [Spartobacteria bacterium]
MKRIYTPAKKKTVLLVDADQIVLHVYLEKFQSLGFKVEVAHDAKQARKTVHQGSIDLVMLDLALPEGDGLELLKSIRSEPGASSLPVVVFCNSYRGNLVREAEAAGATKCVSRAECDASEILALIRQLLGDAVPNLAPSGDDTSAPQQAKAPAEKELVAAFQLKVSQALASLRTDYLVVARSGPDQSHPAELLGMHEQVHGLVGSAGVLGFRRIAQSASALEALLMELHATPKRATHSVIRTLGQALDLLAGLNDETASPDCGDVNLSRVLVVDDEVISRQVICLALGKANLLPVSADDARSAEQLLKQEHFDLILLDVEMPGRSGLELCLEIRQMPSHRTTPVIFVTAHSDFGTQAQSVLNGGNDFIVKPFLPVELAVKALGWLFRKVPQQTATNAPLGGAPASGESVESPESVAPLTLVPLRHE